MKITEIKSGLQDKIDHASANELAEIYGLVLNYFNGSSTEAEWDSLTESQQQRIVKGAQQANAHLGRPLTEVTTRLRNKF